MKVCCGAQRGRKTHSPVSAVSVIRAAGEPGNLADAHVHDAFIPSLDHHPEANVVAERLL